jgi:hypothetical protein
MVFSSCVHDFNKKSLLIQFIIWLIQCLTPGRLQIRLVDMATLDAIGDWSPGQRGAECISSQSQTTKHAVFQRSTSSVWETRFNSKSNT